MSSLRPESAAAMTAHRREAIRLAKAQEQAVFDKCKRANQDAPGYTFDELIGKGSFGRVYKGRQNSTHKVVAIKVVDIDEADFHAFGDQKDEQIRDFNREIQILRQAQDSGAENLNQMIEALPVHSQLWLICEYCPGGSVKTLMRATNDRLAERYLIVVARELAKALKGLHAAGIMHRDVKAANVLIHENGGIQLCDFGVAATLEGSRDKRRTFIGTLHWMPPELWDDKPEYSDEVDVWGYGCTIYECALGRPPNADLRERQQLKMRMRRLKQSISLPEKEEFSEGLRSLVPYALNPDAASRPSMQDILQHDYLTNTEEVYPTHILTELVQHYYAWLFGGGQRVSLFMPGGAAAAHVGDEWAGLTENSEWDFSVTLDFEKRVSAILEIPDFSDLSDPEYPEGDSTPKQIKTTEWSPPKEMSAAQKANFELRVQRGEGLNNLFDQAKPAYEYKTKTDFVPVQAERRISDLPLRAMAEDRPSSIASNVIDLGEFDSDDYAIVAPQAEDHIQTGYAATPAKEEPAFKLADAATIRAKRADSKGPKDARNSSANRSLSQRDPASVPANTSTHDFGTQQDWTIKGAKPTLQEAAEITPTANGPRGGGRDTMQWSFASAMSELSDNNDEPEPMSDDSFQSPPEDEGFGATIREQPVTAKARKHATLDWSFTDAMAEVADDEKEEPTTHRTTPRRPAPMLRTMTQPITRHEVSDAIDDDMPGRPDTALSFTYSESSVSSADLDPFALEAHQDPEGIIRKELEELGVDKFYAKRQRHIYQSSLLSWNGPGPEDDGMSTTITRETPYMQQYPPRSDSRLDDPPHPQPTSARRLGHIRGNGSESSQGSNGTSNIPATPNTVASGPGPAERGRQPTRDNHMHQPSIASSTSTRVSTLGRINFPDPKPPSMAALAADADPEVVERELERLLSEFQGALTAMGEVLEDRVRGRPLKRNNDMTTNAIFGQGIGGNANAHGNGSGSGSGSGRLVGLNLHSESEWEDLDGIEEGQE